MRQSTDVEIKSVEPQHFDVAAEFWLAMRHELAMPDGDLPSDWKARAVAYFGRRYHAGELRWFFAWSDNKPVASAAGFLMDGYPSDICSLRRAGYVAGVFVDPEWRRRGLARAVTSAAVEWLKNLGCTSVRLHAANNARPIYESMGFIASNEMLLRGYR